MECERASAAAGAGGGEWTGGVRCPSRPSRIVGRAFAYFIIGIFTSNARAFSAARSYPASTWRMIPIPGS